MIIRSYFPSTITALLLLLLAGQLHAQQGQSADDRVRLAFEARLSRVIKTMTTRVNAEHAEFGEHLAAMNAAAPLEKRNLDSTHVSANVSRILEFIDYLKHTRAASDSLARDYDDSLYILVTELPPDINSKGIQDMHTTFIVDRDAFNVFLDAMSKLYSDVLDVLIYLQHTPYTLTNGEFTFSEKKDLAEYKKRMKIVDADTKELNKANEDMRKANAKANDHTKNPSDDLDGN
jgi:hypothetical protein